MTKISLLTIHGRDKRQHVAAFQAIPHGQQACCQQQEGHQGQRSQQEEEA
ncbi:hypothetical protein HC928_19145, partial [bacterium]|nr:hypothetical protein [bacterium]